MSGDAIAAAFVELKPLINETEFNAAVNKAIDRINQTASATSRANSGLRTFGATGAAAGSRVAGGMHAAEAEMNTVHNRLEKNIKALEQFEHEGERSGSTFKRVGLRIVEAFSIRALAEFAKKSVEVAENFERINRVVELAFEKTHEVAGVTIKDFDDLAAKMSLATGIQETAILKANEQLIAFTNIRNVAGEGNDIFNRAAAAVEDISVRTGKSATVIANTLGKALEDPAKAALLLRRANILLTSSELDKIKALEKSGNALGAQKVILDGLARRGFVGAAAAAADPLKQLSAGFNQIEKSLGQALLPTIDKIATAIVNHIPDIQHFVEEFGTNLKSALDSIQPALSVVGGLIADLFREFKDNKGLQQAAKYTLEFVVAFKVLKEVVQGYLELQKGLNSLLIVFIGTEEALAAKAALATAAVAEQASTSATASATAASAALATVEAESAAAIAAATTEADAAFAAVTAGAVTAADATAAIALTALAEVTASTEAAIAAATVAADAAVAEASAFALAAAAAADAALAPVAAAAAVGAAPIALIVGAVAAVGVAAFEAYRHVEPFRNAVDQLAQSINDKVTPILKQMADFFVDRVVPVLERVANFIIGVLVVAFKIVAFTLRDLVIPYIKFLYGVFADYLLPVIQKLAEIIIPSIVSAFKNIGSILTGFVIPLIKRFADIALSAFSGLLGTLGTIAHALGFDGLGDKLDKAKAAVERFKTDIDSITFEDKFINITIRTLQTQANAEGSGQVTPGNLDAFNKELQGQLDRARAKAESDAHSGNAAPPPVTTGGAAVAKVHKAAKIKQNADLAQLVRDTIAALNSGLTKGAAQATKTVSELESKIKSTLKGTLQEGLTTKTVAFIEKQRGALVGLAGQYAQTAKQTDLLKKKVDSLRQAANEFKASVLSALQQTSNLDAFLSQSSSNGTGGGNVDKGPLAQASFTGISVGAGVGKAGAQAQGLLKFLADQAVQLTSFKKNLDILIKRVGDTAFVQDLASKGLASADLVASLAAASPDTLKQIDRLQSQVLTLQHNIANAAGKKLQDAADKANVLLKQSNVTQALMLAKITTLSHDIVSGLARLLGTKVPKFADGGIFDRPTFGQFGEAGREVIIPTTRPQRARELMDRSGLTSMVTRSMAQTTTRHTVNHNTFSLVPGGDPAIHAQQVAARLGSMAFR